jgi:hypothetical protein
MKQKKTLRLLADIIVKINERKRLTFNEELLYLTKIKNLCLEDAEIIMKATVIV